MAAKAGRRGRAAAGTVPAAPTSHALFVLDAHTYDAMRVGEVPSIPYSHDRNTLLLAHVAIKRGVAVFVACGPEAARARVARRVERVYPRWAFAPDPVAPAAPPAFAMVVCAGIEGLLLRATYPDAKLVGMLPALHMLEAPGLPTPRFVHDFLRGLRNHVDFVVTQNARMAETLAVLSHWLTRWQPGERIIVAPLGLSADMEGVFDADTPARRALRAETRAAVGLAPSDVLVVNAGGAWNWTDCDTFLEAACLHARAGGRVRVYFSGLTQPDNHEPNLVRDRVEALMQAAPDCFSDRPGDGRPIHVERDWARGGRDVAAMLAAGDLGLSVSKAGFEGWQSHRVRVLDYLGAGLPLLCAGDDLLADAFCDPRLRATPGSVEAYRDILRALEDGRLRDLPTLRRETPRRARASLDGEAAHGAVLDRIEAMPRRSPSEIAELPSGFLELIERQSDARLAHDARLRLREMLAL